MSNSMTCMIKNRKDQTVVKIRIALAVAACKPFPSEVESFCAKKPSRTHNRRASRTRYKWVLVITWTPSRTYQTPLVENLEKKGLRLSIYIEDKRD